MPAERLSMRQIHEVLRLRFASRLPQRAIAKSLGLSQGAVSGYLSRARAAGIVWPPPEDLDAAPSCAGSVIPQASRRCHAPDPDRGVGQLPSQH